MWYTFFAFAPYANKRSAQHFLGEYVGLFRFVSYFFVAVYGLKRFVEPWLDQI